MQADKGRRRTGKWLLGIALFAVLIFGSVLTAGAATKAPGKVTGVKAYDWGAKKGGYFILEKNPYPDIMEGYEWKILSSKGKLVKSGKTYVKGFSVPSLALNQIYTLSVRGFATDDKGAAVYGPWYSKKVIPQPKMKALKLASGNRIKFSWKKVSGAKKYVIYGSTSQTKGYKKIATVSGKKSSYVVSKVKGKKLKKYKTYYLTVQAVSGSTKSTKTNVRSGWIYTVYR